MDRSIHTSHIPSMDKVMINMNFLSIQSLWSIWISISKSQPTGKSTFDMCIYTSYCLVLLPVFVPDECLIWILPSTILAVSTPNILLSMNSKLYRTLFDIVNPFYFSDILRRTSYDQHRHYAWISKMITEKRYYEI